MPIHQWRISFSGDGKGRHLYDFLSQIRLYRESEQVTSNELLSSVVHLFNGRAKLWYQSVHGHYRTWNDLVDAMRNEFLPPGYDFMLLDSISNRLQKPNESASEYMMHMKSLFNCLTVEISEEHMIGIVPICMSSLDQLSSVCRRIDSAYNRSLQIPLIFTETYSQPYYRPAQTAFNNSRELNVVDDEQLDFEEYPEVCAVRRQFNSRSQPPIAERPSLAQRSGGRAKCWNCDGEGHIFPQCTEAKRGKFCYKCGKADVITWHCPNCSGNANRNPDSRGVNPDSSLPTPQ